MLVTRVEEKVVYFVRARDDEHSRWEFVLCEEVAELEPYERWEVAGSERFETPLLREAATIAENILLSSSRGKSAQSQVCEVITSLTPVGRIISVEDL